MEVVKRNLLRLRYVMRHKWFVFVECCRLGVPWLGLIHDLSKFGMEWSPYAMTFCGPWEYDKRPLWLVDQFNLAWKHHQIKNPHHWQHWVLIQDDGTSVALPIPDRYRREMLADWHGAGRAITGKNNTKAWYLDNRDNMQLNARTRDWIESRIGFS